MKCKKNLILKKKGRIILKQFLSQIIKKLKLDKNNVKKKVLVIIYDVQTHTHKKRALLALKLLFQKLSLKIILKKKSKVKKLIIL